jgi:hypothetical protein
MPACLKGLCVPLMGNALFNEYEDAFWPRQLVRELQADQEGAYRTTLYIFWLL